MRMVAERVLRAGIFALALAGLVPGTAGTASAQTGPVAAYGFEEASGTTVTDSSGSGNHGSINGATSTTSGRYGRALSFDGTNDVVVIPDSNSLDLTTGMTIEAWVYPTSAMSDWKAILQKEADAYYLNGNTGQNHAGVGGTFAGVCCTTTQSPGALPLNQWTHVAGTYDGASLRLYLNGTQVGTQSRTGSLEVNGNPVRIGGNTYGTEFFPGRIDELRIYNRALSPSEIQSDMNTPISGGSPPPTTPLFGSWGPVIAWPHIPISIATLADGRVLSWSSTETNAFPSSTELTHSAIYDPSTGTFQTTDNNFHDMFCAGVSTLEDGRIVAAGGNPYDTRVSAFNPSTLVWQALANMNETRWYGTLLALPSNDLFATFANAASNVSERYSPATNTWVRTGGAPMTDLLNEQNAENGQSPVNNSGGLEWWGQMAVTPDGRVLHGGPTQTWHLFDPRNSGGVQSLGKPADPTRTRMWGNAVTYDVGKVLILGGTDRTLNPPTTNAGYKVDLNGPTPVISPATSMGFARAFHNTVTLPTGELIVIGGNSSGTQFTDANAVLAAEIWNPATDQWRTVASMSMARGYHSTALLLKDGRVISAGGGACGNGCSANHLDAQIYSPPYLFAADGSAAPRPSITASPAIGQAGDAISVTATGTITKFSMVRIGATTHAMNTDQRYVPIPFTANGGGAYTLQLHSNPNVLIPGYYWIFAVDSAGVPSIGRTFQVLRNDGGLPLGLEAEAESAVLAGSFAVGSDTAARNGRYISVPSGAAVTTGPTSPSRAVLSFSVAQAGQYKIEASVLAPSSTQNSFWITVDGQPASGFVWEMPVSSVYQNDFVSDSSTATDPVIVSLAAGNHTVSVIHREAGTRLDWMRLVQVTDPTLDSDGDGVPDVSDAFPNDPTEWADTDHDGHGDNSDAFPNDPTRWLPEHGVTPVSAPFNSTTLIVEGSSGADRIWSVNPDDRTVTVMSAAGSVVAEVGVGDRPWSLAKAPLANEVFVTNKGSATISVISTQTLAPVRTITLPAASQPHGISFAPASDTFYVALEALGRVEKRTRSTGALQASATLSGKPRHLAVSADGQTLYVTNFVTPRLPGEDTAVVNVSAGGGQLFVVATSAMTLSQTIAFGYSSRAPAEVSGPGIANYLNAPVLYGSKAYVPSKQDNVEGGAYRGRVGMVFDQTVRAVTSVVDLPSSTELTGQRIDHDNAGLATGAAITGDGRYLFVALETSREVAVYDTQQGFQLARIPVGRAPEGVAFSSNGRTLYVHNFMDRTVSRFDVTNMVALGSSQATGLGSVATVANELLAPNVLQGKKLFYDAADDRLALDNYISCASCHNDGGQDGRVWDLTGFGEGLRNTIELRGRAGMGHGPLHWTGNFDEVQDFEGQIRGLSGGTGLMSNADFNTGTRSQPLGDPKAGISADLDALAAYVASLNAAPASPYRNGAFSAQAEQGRATFANRACGSCHSGTSFTDSAPNLRHDVGTIHAGSGSRLGAALDGFDTPTLLGSWGSAPHLHDGSAASLEAAISAHQTVTPTELAALAAFLRELNPGDQQPQPGDVLVNSSVSVVFARGNPCGTNYTAITSKCVGNLLALTGVAVNPTAIESSLHTGKQSKAFVSTNSGTPLANLIFDLGAPGVADAIVMWHYNGPKTDPEIRGYEIRTSNALAAGGQSLANPVTAATGTLVQGTVSNAGQRINGLTLQRYVQLVGLSNYGNSSTNALGAIAFVNAP